jgi:hypothetical protein
VVVVGAVAAPNFEEATSLALTAGFAPTADFALAPALGVTVAPAVVATIEATQTAAMHGIAKRFAVVLRAAIEPTFHGDRCREDKCR